MSKENHELKQATVQEINRLSKMNGGKITPRQLVDAAKDEGSPLHGYFEWDNSTAADKYREIQARVLLRSCTVNYTVNLRTIKIPKYIRDPEEDSMSQGYTEVAILRSEKDIARQALIQEYNRVRALLKRARHLAKYFDMEPDMDDLIEALGLMCKRAEDAGPQLNA